MARPTSPNWTKPEGAKCLRDYPKRKGPGARITPRQIEAVAAMLRDGATYSQIATYWKVDTDTARHRCNRRGLYSRNMPGAPKGNKNGCRSREKVDA